jgi:hypothetical protein
MTQRVPVISPELVLVDPALAEIARAELPDPGQFLAARLSAAPEPEPAVHVPRLDEPESAAEPPAMSQAELRPTRRRSKALRAVLVGSLLLLAGFAAGRMTATPPPGFTIEQALQEATPARSPATAAVTPTEAQAAPADAAVPRPHAKSSRAGRGVAGAPHGRGLDAASKRRGPHTAAAGRIKRPSSNVLGVVVSLTPAAVTIRWRAPASSRQVIVLRRARGARASKVIYRGRRTWLRDASLRPGRYTYVIVNYDRGRRASSGVPTVVDVSGTDL